MDFNLKQWREHQQESEEDHHQQQPFAEAHRHHLLLESPNQNQPQEAAAALPLFVSSEPHNNKATTTHFPSSTPTAIPTASPRYTRVGGGGYCFSIAQWQELELQALIFRHMIAGAAIPPELLQLLKKSLLTSSASPYYLHHYSPHFHHAALVQGGCWGKGAMDPEPGRCRRTDGKKWRCSRDVVAGHKYCERHVHRGRNRSRKPVEFPSSVSASGGGSSVGGGSSATFAFGSGGSGGTQFSLSASGDSSLDAFQLNQGSSSELSHHEHPSVRGGKSDNSRVLMHFFDDWPRSLQQSDNSESNGGGNPSSSRTGLSMSTPANQTSDFLRLSTGNVDEVGPRNAGGWAGGSQVGGPLGEALRSSTNSSSPTSVLLLHRYPRCSSDNTSYVTA